MAGDGALVERLRRHGTGQRVMAMAMAVLLGAVLVGGVAAAMDGTNTIHACVRGGGQVRVVAEAEGCRENETALQWNVQGPAGELTGPAGGALTGTYPDPGLADGAVSTWHIVDGAIGTSKIFPHAVDASRLSHSSSSQWDHLRAVTTDHIRNGAVTTRTIDDGAVTGPKIAENAVTSMQLANWSVRAANVGPITRRGGDYFLPVNSTVSHVAHCLADERAIGGGFGFTSNDPGLAVRDSFLEFATNGWRVKASNATSSGHLVIVEVYCLNP